MQRVVPALRIKSFKASIAFYEMLGFKEQWRHQFEPGFPIFASIAREGMEIYLTEHTGDCQFGGLVHFSVENVDDVMWSFNDEELTSRSHRATRSAPTSATCSWWIPMGIA